MKTSLEGRVFLARHEAVCLTAYDDGTGVATIGIGHTSRAGPPRVRWGMTISLERAFEIFANDLERFEEAVERELRRDVPQHVFDALVSFCFNVGPGNFRRSSVLRRLNEGRPVAEAAARLALWNRAGGRILPGLTRRRAEERRLMASGGYGDLSTLLAYSTVDARRRPAGTRRMSTAPLLRPPPEPKPAPGAGVGAGQRPDRRLAGLVGTLFALLATGLVAVLAQGD